MLARLKNWAALVKRDLHALWRAARDPRVPWPAKLVAAAVVAYALSPIDLIPDFIPVLGYLDDLIIVPLGLALALRMIPPDILAEHRATAEATPAPPRSLAAAIVIALLWIAFAGVAGLLFYRTLFSHT